MTKIDLKKDLKQLYSASPDKVALVDVPPLTYLMAQGQGDPNTSSAFQQATETLFRISYTLKFMLKKEQGADWAVMPLEGLWSADDPSAFVQGRKDEWRWILLILQPEFITPEQVAQARELAQNRKGAPPLADTRLSRFTEGLSAQVLHVGPYAEVIPTIDRLHAFIREKGYQLGGQHYEIYLSDPRRTAPAKLKTIMRQPVTLEAAR